MAEAELPERVAALEAAVARLVADHRACAPPEGGDPSGAESSGAESSGAATSGAEPTDERFFLLQAVKARVPEGAVGFAGDVPLPTGERYEWQWMRPVDLLLDTDWSTTTATLAALAHPVRLRLLHRVLTGTRSTAELAADPALGTTGQLYHHLRQLVAAGWLHSSSRGRYAVPSERVVPLLVILMGAQR
jgi:hypothetical protein